MPQNYISPKSEVEKFLTELKSILNSDDVKLDYLRKKATESRTDPYTTENTLLRLNYDSDDIKRHLKSLKVSEYSETAPDIRNPNSPVFYVFYQVIQSKDVYIKVKIRDVFKKKVFCISFHFARYPVNMNAFPYK